MSLFHRAPKKITLTDAGVLLFDKAIIILDTLSSINTELHNLAGTPKGNLRIGIPPMVETLFSKAIAEFNALYPQITIDLAENGSRKVEQQIRDGTLDVGIVVLPTRDTANLETVSFLKDPLMLIVNVNHPLATKSIVDMKDLSDESFVLYRDDFALRDHILDKCKEIGFVPRVVCETAQWDFIVDIVASKLAIAFLPQTLCTKLDEKLIRYVPLKNEIKPWHLAIAWKKNAYLSYATKAWLEYSFKLFGLSK